MSDHIADTDTCIIAAINAFGTIYVLICDANIELCADGVPAGVNMQIIAPDVTPFLDGFSFEQNGPYTKVRQFVR